MASESFCMSSGGGEAGDPAKFKEMMRTMYGPQAVDQQIRQAIHTCWMLLPDDQRSPELLEAEIRRVVERALANFKEDAKSFGT